jgi:hypothetical protein
MAPVHEGVRVRVDGLGWGLRQWQQPPVRKGFNGIGRFRPGLAARRTPWKRGEPTIRHLPPPPARPAGGCHVFQPTRRRRRTPRAARLRRVSLVSRTL